MNPGLDIVGAPQLCLPGIHGTVEGLHGTLVRAISTSQGGNILNISGFLRVSENEGSQSHHCFQHVSGLKLSNFGWFGGSPMMETSKWAMIFVGLWWFQTEIDWMSLVAGWQLDLGAAVGSKLEVPRTKYCRTFLLCNILAMSWVADAVTPCHMQNDAGISGHLLQKSHHSMSIIPILHVPAISLSLSISLPLCLSPPLPLYNLYTIHLPLHIRGQNNLRMVALCVK